MIEAATSVVRNDLSLSVTSIFKVANQYIGAVPTIRTQLKIAALPAIHHPEEGPMPRFRCQPAKALPKLSLAMVCPLLFVATVRSVAMGASAEHMWGTAGDSQSSTAAEQALAHRFLGETAGQVNAAQAGVLYSSNITIMTIGSQNIISVTGDGNNVSGQQSATNSGSISTSSNITNGAQ